MLLFGLVCLSNGISTCLDYLMLKLSLKNNGSGTECERTHTLIHIHMHARIYVCTYWVYDIKIFSAHFKTWINTLKLISFFSIYGYISFIWLKIMKIKILQRLFQFPNARSLKYCISSRRVLGLNCILWWGTSSRDPLPLLQGSLWPEVLAPVSTISIDQIDLFKELHIFYWTMCKNKNPLRNCYTKM